MRATRALILLAVTALSAAACGESGSAAPAAVVDGVEIDQQAVVDELEAIGGNDLYTQGYENVFGVPIFGTEAGTFDAAFVNATLALQIQYRLVQSEVEARDLVIDDGCATAGLDSAVRRLGPFAQDRNGQAVFDAFPKSYQDVLAARETSILRLIGELIGVGCFDDDAARAYFDANPDRFATACASHILVETEEEAEDVIAQLEDGADFAELAREVSTDPAAIGAEGEQGAGGDYGCFDRTANFVQPFLEAAMTQPVGVPGPPVQTEFGYHVLLVRERTPQTFEEAAQSAQLAVDAAADAAFGEFFRPALAGAAIEVDPRYGTWDPTQAEITRPVEEPTTPTTLPEG